MQNGQWSLTAAKAHYLHDDDEAKQDAQMKRISRRTTQAKQARRLTTQKLSKEQPSERTLAYPLFCASAAEFPTLTIASSTI